jgi:hypothetical protein
MPKFSLLNKCKPGELIRLVPEGVGSDLKWAIVADNSEDTDLLKVVILEGGRAPYFRAYASPSSRCLNYGSDFNVVPELSGLCTQSGNVGSFAICDNSEHGIVINARGGDNARFFNLSSYEIIEGVPRALFLKNWSIWRPNIIEKGEPLKLFDADFRDPSGADA